MTNWTNVLIGALVIAAVFYVVSPRFISSEGFAGNFDTSAGGIFGLVIIGIFVVAMLFAMMKGLTSR